MSLEGPMWATWARDIQVICPRQMVYPTRSVAACNLQALFHFKRRVYTLFDPLADEKMHNNILKHLQHII
jgi:hypothetical protein